MAGSKRSTGRLKLALWETGTVVWVCVAGSALHFAFELSEYWRPMALFAAVNESAWEHTKMYFWPGLFAALVQYTYTRDVANNYWLGKAAALAITPVLIWLTYFSYMSWVVASGSKASLPTMLSIMVLGISAGQAASWTILTRPPLQRAATRTAAGVMATLTAVFATFSYFPPKFFLFENFFCYEYTGEYGILDDYAPYRVFVKVGADGSTRAGGGVNYCAGRQRGIPVAGDPAGAAAPQDQPDRTAWAPSDKSR
ncbi:MAG: DUF6512 family protein [Gammaproteobacteria bacterium]|nr:DUF6512 family protein [Gammaproteobacteria bacterium]